MPGISFKHFYSYTNDWVQQQIQPKVPSQTYLCQIFPAVVKKFSQM